MAQGVPVILDTCALLWLVNDLFPCFTAKVSLADLHSADPSESSHLYGAMTAR